MTYAIWKYNFSSNLSSEGKVSLTWNDAHKKAKRAVKATLEGHKAEEKLSGEMQEVEKTN